MDLIGIAVAYHISPKGRILNGDTFSCIIYRAENLLKAQNEAEIKTGILPKGFFHESNYEFYFKHEKNIKEQIEKSFGVFLDVAGRPDCLVNLKAEDMPDMARKNIALEVLNEKYGPGLTLEKDRSRRYIRIIYPKSRSNLQKLSNLQKIIL